MQVEAVVFDIGNVLIEWRPEAYFDRAIGEARRRAMFDAVDIHGMMDRIDAGQEFSEAVAETAAAFPDWQTEILWFRDRWCDIARPAIDHSVRLLHGLRAAGVPVFALSNFGVQNFPMSEAMFPFLGAFDRRYISGEMGLIKPDPAIYAAVEADCGIAPEALLFADDRADNIAAARARGWRVHLFEKPEDWASCLVEHGLLSAEAAT